MNYKTYDNYKDSNIPWIGKIPPHWECRKINTLSLVRRGASPRPIDDSVYFDDNGEYSWVRISDVTSSKKYLEKTTQSLSTLGKSLSVPIEPGNIFISIAATVGKPIITNIKCCIHDGFVYFKNLKLNNEYLYYIFEGEKVYEGLGKLGTQLNLNTETIGKIYVPFPPNEEQKQIGSYLNNQINKIDMIIAKNEELICLLEEKRFTLINQSVTKGLNPDTSMKDSGVEWIGEIPEHWECRKINTLSSVSRGASPRPIDNPIYFDDNGEYSWVRISDVTSSNKYLKRTTEKLSILGKSLSVPIEPGNVIVSITATVGKPIITNIKCCIHDGFVYFKNLNLNDEYLFYIFEGGEAYKGLGKLGTQLNLNTETIGKIYVPVPPNDEQREIIDYLDKKIEKIDKTMNKVQENIILLNEYKTSLIHNVVTGKIDVRSEEI